MIKLENFEVLGWEHAIRGMRNPMNSWEKSDSGPCMGICGTCGGNDGNGHCLDKPYILGPNDHDLMMKLRNAGTDHRKYMRMITVYVDITAPLYWWKEADTYKVGIVANSCSTMHKIHEKEFTLEDFSCEHLTEASLSLLEDVIISLNVDRAYFNKYDEKLKKDLTQEKIIELAELKKDHWWNMIQLLPSSYNQRRTVMLNYEVLANIYKSRKNHKLDEWREFCKWIESLPYSEIITGNIKESED